jgi:tetratricopeptide (TPR) repeat protein
MKSKVECVALLIAFGLLEGSAFSQKPAAQQNLTVVVVNAHVQPSQPVQSLRVSLSYLDGDSRITDARDLTNSHGQALLHVSEDAAARGDIRIEITGATDLVIYQPADGQLSAVPSTVTIQLLPKGSPALLGPAQIEAILHRSLLQVGSLQQKNRLLKQEIAQGANQKQGLDDALAAWAKANGFDSTEVDQHVQEWAKEIQARAERASVQQKALAELALKHYGAAGQLFEKAEYASTDADPEEEEMMKRVRARSGSVLRNASQAAGAFQLNLQYHEATTALEHAQEYAANMHKKYPEDVYMWAFWLQTIKGVAGARVEEGAASSAGASLPLLVQAAKDYESVAAEYQKVGERDGWADTQDSLGYTLWNAGRRAPADKAMALLEQAVQAYQHALEVRTQAARAQDWAVTENNLAVALGDEAQRAPADKAEALLDQAAQALQKVVQVSTKAAHPQDWAGAENSLGVTLSYEGKLVPGDKGLALLGQSVQAFQSALEVYTKADYPRDWARVQNNLGSVLHEEGQRLPADKAGALFEQAVHALRSALEVETMAALPQAWATTQNNLAGVLSDQAKLAPDDQAFDLFEQAVLAYQNSLKVYTKTDLPQNWARSEDNMGVALCDVALRAPTDQAKTLFDLCVQAHQNALEVYTKADLPQYWAVAESSLGIALDEEGQRAPADQAAALYEQAAVAYRNALEVNTKAVRPWDWAETQYNLGLMLWREAQVVSGEKAAALLDQAAQADQNVLQVYTQANNPHEWALTQSNLGVLHAAQGNYSAALKDDEAALAVYPKDVAGTLRVAEANLTVDHFDACLKEAATVDDAEVAGRFVSYMVVRETLKVACQWGIGDKGSALQTEKSLSPRTSQMIAGWNSSGTRRFLSTSPTFATGRASWVALFTSLQNGDGAGMTAALHQLEMLMQN